MDPHTVTMTSQILSPSVKPLQDGNLGAGIVIDLQIACPQASAPLLVSLGPRRRASLTSRSLEACAVSWEIFLQHHMPDPIVNWTSWYGKDALSN